MKKITGLFAFIAAIFIFACHSKPGAEQVYEYVPLDEYVYSAADVQPGTEVQLLAFSGGREADEESVYYYQFIVLNKTTKDTLRILTSLISVANEGNKTYTTPLQYDPAKGITDAVYEPRDSAQNLLLQVESVVKDGKIDSLVDINSMMRKINKKQFVVVNKSMPEFDNRNYPTAIGALHFKDQPW